MRSRVGGLIEPKSFLALLSCVSIATCTACSSGYKFSAAFPDLFSESNPNSAADESEGDGVSTVSDGSPGNSVNNKSIISIEDPELEEIPAVEVAGSNLISICFDLDTHGRAEDSAAIHCSVANKSKQAVLLKADAFKLQSAHERAEYLARGVSPIPKSPASGWDMLPEEKIEIHFEVPKNVLYSIRSQPVQVVIENASLDGVHLPRDAILKTSIKDYFKKDPRCELEAMESIVTIEFKNMTHESPNSPDAKNSDGVRFWGSALSNSVSDKSIFCDAEFQEDLYFEWPAGVPPGLRRMAGTIAGGLGLFTDVHPDDIPLAFRFDPVSFLWMMVKPLENFSIQEQMRRLTPPLMNRANWCVFGRGDCLSREAGDVSVREVVHLSRIAKGFLVPNIHNLFTPEGSLSESKKVMRVLRLRFHYYNNSNLSPVPLNEGRIPLRVNYIPPPL